MITDRTLADLRTAAAISLLVPDIGVSVRVGDHLVVEAARPPFEVSTHPVLPVCSFHRSVVRAHQLRTQGTRVEMVGLDGGLEPDIGLRCSPAVKQIPGGVVRHAGSTWLHLLALALPIDVVETAASSVFAETGSELDVHLHADRSLDVTIVVTDTPLRDKGAARGAVGLIEAIAARATVASLVDLVEPSTADLDQMLITPTVERSGGSAPGAPRRP
ncbi:MAG: hypothetical protein OSA99_02750 [Acidimicrobiales bacterium]|nr:hypothetical protein [Acidimicrobiales bacterium]